MSFQVRLHDMVEQLVEQNGRCVCAEAVRESKVIIVIRFRYRLMENQQLLVAEVKRLRGLLGQPVDDNGVLEIPVQEQEEY